MFFLFFLIIDLYLLPYTLYLIDLYLIPAVIAKIFNPIAELVISIGFPTKQAKVKMEKHPVIIEIKISKWSI